MRRKDREITDIGEIYAILKKCDVCSVAFHDEPYPYVIPLNFGAARSEVGEITLYFHGAAKGKKLDLLARNPHVAFSADCSHELKLYDEACECTMAFESVCGNGTLEVLDKSENLAALRVLMAQYSNMSHGYDERAAAAVTILRLTVNEITGKRSVG